MSPADWLGSVGVGLLLLAFLLNLLGRAGRGSRLYQALNAIGAGLACWAAYLIGFLPFVILEGTWSVVAAVTLLRPGARRAASRSAAR